jgi:hypothetical protein
MSAAEKFDQENRRQIRRDLPTKPPTLAIFRLQSTFQKLLRDSRYEVDYKAFLSSAIVTDPNRTQYFKVKERIQLFTRHLAEYQRIVKRLYSLYGWRQKIHRQDYKAVKELLPEAKKFFNLKAKAKSTLEQMREQRTAFNPKLRLPKDGRNHRRINIKNIKTCFGEITSSNIENNWSQLCTYGEREKWSHDDFKLALKMTLASDCQRYYAQVEKKSLRSILEGLTSRYVVETMTTKMTQLHKFKRDQGESIQSAMERYRTVLLLTEASVPPRERKQRTKDMLTRALESICSPSAKSAIAKYRSDARTRGTYATYDSLRNAAIMAEEIHNDPPNEDRPVESAVFASHMQRPGPKDKSRRGLRAEKVLHQTQSTKPDNWNKSKIQEGFQRTNKDNRNQNPSDPKAYN